MIPHEKDCRCVLCKAEAAINSLSDEQIAELPVWKAWEYAFPFGTVTEVAGSMGLPHMTVESWTVSPEKVSASDPNGRRGLGYEISSCLLGLNAVFAPGAQFLLRYYTLKVVKGQRIKGEQMRAVLALADEARQIEDEARALEEKSRAFREKIAAITSMGKT